MTNTTFDQRVAATVRAELARAGISQAAAARHLGLSTTVMSRRLQGRKSLSVDELHRIAELIGIPDYALLPVGPLAA